MKTRKVVLCFCTILLSLLSTIRTENTALAPPNITPNATQTQNVSTKTTNKLDTPPTEAKAESSTENLPLFQESSTEETPEISAEELGEIEQEVDRQEAEKAQLQNASAQLKLLGILQVKNIQTKMENNQFSISASVDLFGYEAQIALESLKPLIFSITLPKAISIPISPWKQIGNIQKFELHISDTKKELFTKATLLTKDDIKIGFEIDPDDNYAHITIPEFHISSIIPVLKQTPLHAIYMKNAQIKISNIFYPKKKHPITIAGMVDFSQLELPLPIKLQNLSASASIDLTKGFTLKAGLENFEIPSLATVKQAMLQLFIPATYKKADNQTQKTPELTLLGKINVTVPFTNQTIETDLLSKYTASKTDPKTGIKTKGRFDFQTTVQSNINFKDIISFDNFTLNISTDGSASVKGTTTILKNIFDLHISAALHIRKQVDPGTGKSKMVVELEGHTDKPFKPFAKIPTPIQEFKNIEVEQVKVSLSSDNKFVLIGKSKILNIETEVDVIVDPPNNIVVKAMLPHGWKLSDSIKGTEALNFVELEKAALIISTYTYFDRQLDQKINKGLTITASTKLDDPNINKIKKVLQGLPTSMTMSASLGPSFTDVNIIIKVPLELKIIPIIGTTKSPFPTFINYLSFANANIEIGLEGGKPKIFLAGQLKLQPTPQDEMLLFTGKAGIEFMPKPAIVMEESMEGMWNNPFGVQGLAIGNVGLALGITIQEIAPPPFVVPVPAKIGFTGTMKLFDKTVKVAGQYSQAGDIVIDGEFQGSLVFSDLLSIPIELAKNIEREIEHKAIETAKVLSGKTIDIAEIEKKMLVSPKDLESAKEHVTKLLKNAGMDDIKIKDVKLYLVPKATKIGEIAFDPGLTLQGQVFYKGIEEAAIYANLDTSGLIVKGHGPNIKMGLLTVSGYSPDPKEMEKASKQGPMIDLVAKPPLNFHLKTNGLISIGKDFFGYGYADIGLDHIKYAFETKILDMFDAKISGKTEGIGENVSFVGNGSMKIGNTEALLDLRISKSPYLVGHVEKLSLQDLLNFTEKAGIKIPTEVLPQIGITNATLALAAHKETVENLTIHPGLSISGTMQVGKANINIAGTVDKQGLLFKEKQKGTITLGPLAIRDASIDLAITPKDQHLKIHGDTTLLGIMNNQTNVQMTKETITFDTKSKFLGQFEADIQGTSVGNIKNPATLDFNITGHLKNDFSTYIENMAIKQIQTTSKQIETEAIKVEETIQKGAKQVGGPIGQVVDWFTQTVVKPTTRFVTKTVSNVTTLFVKLTAGAIVVEEAWFTTSMQAQLRGELPKLQMRIKLYGIEHRLKNIQIYVNRPDLTFKSIIQTIKDLVTPLAKQPPAPTPPKPADPVDTKKTG